MNALLASSIATLRARRVVTACVVTTLLLGGANYFLWKDRLNAGRQHDEVRRKGEFMLRALANRSRIDTDLAALEAALTQIERHLLDEESMEVNLGYFYRLEKPARVRLVRLNQLASLPAVEKSRFKSVPFSMQVTGSYRNAMSFLRALETGPRIIRIRNCTFERSPTDNTTFLLDLTVDALAKS
jgi:Tfp pilus assembly protein PilO